MAPGKQPTLAGRLRSGGLLSVVAGLASALTLTGAAVYTVEGATCGDGGQYVRHARHIELVGSCVDGAELPPAPAPDNGAAGTDRGGSFTGHSNYRP